MKIILREEVSTLGKAGEIKNVSDGYARNFLIPRGLAEPATESNLQTLNQRLVQRAAMEAKKRAGFQVLAEKLSQTTLRFTLTVGEKGQVFGSITAQDIADELVRRGMNIERSWVQREQPIKAGGEYSLKIQLPQGILAEVQIVVTPQADTAKVES